MSTTDLASLDAWLETELKPQPPVSRTLRPGPVMRTPVLAGHLQLWHNRVCDSCGSEHLEFAANYECYVLPNGSRNIRATSKIPEDSLLPIFTKFVQRTAPVCSECYTPESTEEADHDLANFQELLT